tara:strand:- start:253 stop:702 length:450 start_codon:yes stop_codon:yes gene_type:complete
MIKKNLIIFLLFITSCGYQPIFVDKNINKLSFKKILTTGDKNINRKFISISGFEEKSKGFSFSELNISSKRLITETSKNAKGQASSYRMTVQINIVTKDINNISKSKLFSESFSYNNIENKYDLAQYQNEIENTLINKIFEKLIIFFKL